MALGRGWVGDSEASRRATAAGAFHRVPVLIGTNADEGSPVVARNAKINSLEPYRDALEAWHNDEDGILLRAYPAKDVAGIIPPARTPVRRQGVRSAGPRLREDQAVMA